MITIEHQGASCGGNTPLKPRPDYMANPDDPAHPIRISHPTEQCGVLHIQNSRRYYVRLSLRERVTLLFTGGFFMWSRRDGVAGDLFLHIGRQLKPESVGRLVRPNCLVQ